ncbi:hypothetical protein CNYM01_09347 [Colletotrichum nymphaeae SA-01]|uniref:Uncharacterized protein n=1 Tax=Colletotrichum nymphaeae SA-01 TaxID=1460502 RepID=A0A135S4T2_9PEZI|nr:hypothetical protein CNYM01_09347 [Colletotrichum nymphaeae SA-01]
MSTFRETRDSTPTFARRSISPTSRGSYIDAIESIELRTETDDPLSGDHLGTYNPIATEESRAPSPDVSRIGPEVQGTVGMPGDARAPCRPLTKLATLRAWTFELLALVVSVASFVAIIILLKIIPTVVGAVVILASYAIGPFSQQAASSYSCNIESHGVAKIAIAEWVGTQDAASASLPPNWLWLSPEMHTIAMNGLLTGETNRSLGLFQCDSSNCTFPTTSMSDITHISVGLCSRCVDIRPSLKETHYAGGGSPNDPLTWEYSLANDMSITQTYESNILHMKTPTLPDRRKVDFDFESGTLNTTILTFTVAGCKENNTLFSCEHNYDNMPNLNEHKDIVAVNCSLYPCLRSYNGNISNGMIEEKLVSTSPISRAKRDSSEYPTIDPGYVAMIELCILDGIWYSVSNITKVLRSSNVNWTLWVSRNLDHEAPSACVKTMDSVVFFSVLSMFESHFSARCSAQAQTKAGAEFGPGTWPTSNGLLGACSTGWWVEGLHDKGKASFEIIYTAFNNTATAITNRMRTYDDNSWSRDSQAFVRGNGTQAAVCIRADWLWLLYPGVLLLLTSTLFLQAYVESCTDRIGQPIWKSTILPLLFYNIISENSNPGDEDSPTPVVGPTVPLLQLRELESLAEKTVVRFCTGLEGGKEPGPGLLVEENSVNN